MKGAGAVNRQEEAEAFLLLLPAPVPGYGTSRFHCALFPVALE